jgi:hypothetical protein
MVPRECEEYLPFMCIWHAYPWLHTSAVINGMRLEVDEVVFVHCLQSKA